MSDEAEAKTEPPVEATPGRDAQGRFVPGSVHNPGGLGGRPKGSSFLLHLERELATIAPNGKTRQENLVAKLLELAEAGDVRAMDLVLRRIAPEKLSIESDGIPLVLLRNFAGVEPEPARLPEGPAGDPPVLSVGDDEPLPEGADRLPDGTVRWRLSS